MAIGQYEIWLDHWNGTRLAFIDGWLNLEYTRALHGVGALALQVPSSFDDAMLQVDYKIEVWRALPGEAKRLENVYLIRGWKQWTDQAGVNYTTIIGVDGNDVLKRRFVWAQPGSTQARKTDNACDLIKAYMREALTTADAYGTDPQDWRGQIATYFTVAADDGLGQSFTKNYEGKTLFDVANGIAETSTGRGTVVWWYVCPVSGAEYQLRTYTPLLGQDLTGQVTLTPDFAMAEGNHEYSGIDEFNMVVGWGGKIGWAEHPDYRKSDDAYNLASIRKSAFSWREKFLDCGDEPDYDAIADACIEEVTNADNLAQQTFQCGLSELENFRYGREWDFGDKVKLSYRGVQMDAVVKTVHVTVGATERIEVFFKIDQTLNIQTS